MGDGVDPQLTRCVGKLGSSPYFGAFRLRLKGQKRSGFSASHQLRVFHLGSLKATFTHAKRAMIILTWKGVQMRKFTTHRSRNVSLLLRTRSVPLMERPSV